MFANVPFKVENHELKMVDGAFQTEWFSGRKPGLKEINPLVNLPYIIDGTLVVSQSNACLSYLGKKFGLWGKDLASSTRCDELLCEIFDLRNKMTGFAYAKHENIKNAAENLLADVKGKNGILQKLELILVQQGPTWGGFNFVADYVTAPDFHAWEMLDQYAKLTAFFELPSLFADFPKLAAFHAGFASLPGNAKYLANPLFTQLPFNNLGASFGSTLSGHQFKAGAGYEGHGLSGMY